MQTVDVTISVPQAEKDVIDALVKQAADLKSGNGQNIADLFAAAIKLGGEFGEFKSELQLKASVSALAYLEIQLAALYIADPASAAPSA